MKKFTGSFLMLICFVSSAYSQDKDYAVSMQADTIKGKMNIIDNPLSGHSLVVKAGKKKEQYPSYKISHLYKNGDTYHVAKIEGKYQFIKLIQEGFLSLYRYSPSDQQSAQMFQGSILITKDGRQKVVPNLGFKKQLAEFLEDCKSVSIKIENGELNKKDLTEIIDEYNACVPQDYTAKPGDIVEEIVYIPDTSKIDELISGVKSDADLSSNKELLEILEDLKKRKENGDDVPGYLSNILKNNLQGKEDLLKLLTDILEE
ncbi:hypothetical protein [Reichenbachiella sp. MALMAid0571]|uniref:hypothetical protein n=1 Tax=Reichenbachiella sp. MALMAid0571 TaxID=3143939 RepID=UPI0032E04348